MIDINFANPAFFVSGGKEVETIHDWHRRLAQKMLGLNAPIIPTKGILGFLVMWIRIFSCCAISFKTLPFPEKLKGF